MTIIAAVGGVLGAKVFHILENLGLFFQNPLGMIFSTGGLTFYGGLIVAGGSIAWYLRKQGVSIRLFADAVAPGLTLGYWHRADWVPPRGRWRLGQFAADLAAEPDWLPMWLWAETCFQTPSSGRRRSPSDPTSIYEAVAGVALFGALWGLRKHPYQAGWSSSALPRLQWHRALSHRADSRQQCARLSSFPSHPGRGYRGADDPRRGYRTGTHDKTPRGGSAVWFIETGGHRVNHVRASVTGEGQRVSPGRKSRARSAGR
ncbi:MAG: prolipoprotein diacylglyceryl transferase family protein [Gammaproteobacteria bacterium]|nr:prolipoprotein diacylglyceryl transferase family protein [Gammaproteobacteria bacterium]